ncbi:membrane protein [Caldovatus sediminis]|uniref:Membrane protein n=1 Tax=Caldovatus sediminis TaxID=2041189 RepID=A0A8J2ZEL5_9PROT|nr:DUF1232 domain-containing protein [Caldovatus sediminis]GGG47345.1 membrane protein [Caldovatus sediminis]
MLARLRSWARAVRRDALLLWLAARDPRVPPAAKLLAAAIAAYAFSPLDLIPDAIPLLGLLDEAILLPLLVLLTLRLIPPALREELRARAATLAERPVSRAGAALVVALWAAATALGAWWLFARLAGD